MRLQYTLLAWRVQSSYPISYSVKKEKDFSLNEIIVLLISFIFVVLNRDASNFSLGLMWILYFMLRKSEIDLKK